MQQEIECKLEREKCEKTYWIDKIECGFLMCIQIHMFFLQANDALLVSLQRSNRPNNSDNNKYALLCNACASIYVMDNIAVENMNAAHFILFNVY